MLNIALCKTDLKRRMPSRNFTPDDVIIICGGIARQDNIVVQQPNKKSSGIFRKLSSSMTNNETSTKQEKVPQGNTLGAEFDSIPSMEGPSKNNNTNDTKQNTGFLLNPNIPGLNGRDVVAMAILVDKAGSPIRTYTETQKIPSDEVDAANNIFISRVPVSSPKGPEKDDKGNYKALADVLDDLDIKQSTKLWKRMGRILTKLHTTDLNTALSFLKVDRYKNVRQEIKEELISFAKKELKLVL